MAAHGLSSKRRAAFTDMKLFPILLTVLCIFPMPAPHLDQKASTCEGDGPQGSVGCGVSASATE